MSSLNAHASLAPAFFPSAGRQLFGCLHEPQGDPQERAVLLVAPFGHEAVRSHRAFRRLAGKLAAHGLTVLRFDFTGCGDSAGDLNDASWDIWRADLASATRYLRSQSRCRRITCIGMRGGANLALQVGVERGEFDQMVLWQPILEGAQALEHLRAMHRALIDQCGGSPTTSESSQASLGPAVGEEELLGYAYPSTLIQQLEQLQALPVPGAPASRVLLVDNGQSSTLGALESELRTHGVDVESAHLPDAEIWHEEVYKALLPHPSLQTMEEWVTRS